MILSAKEEQHKMEFDGKTLKQVSRFNYLRTLTEKNGKNGMKNYEKSNGRGI